MDNNVASIHFTKIKQRNAIVRLSIYMWPYLILGLLDIAYSYYHIIDALMTTQYSGVYGRVFLFLFNCIAPWRGFINGMVFLMGWKLMKMCGGRFSSESAVCKDKKMVEELDDKETEMGSVYYREEEFDENEVTFGRLN